MNSITQIEPLALTIGDSWRWARYDLNSRYPEADGWALKYHYKNVINAFDFDMTSDADGWNAYQNAAATAARQPGLYRWALLGTLAGDRVSIETGTADLLPDPAVPGDPWSWAERALQQVEAILEDRAGADDTSYSVLGRSVSREDKEQLVRYRDWLLSEVKRIRDAELRRYGKQAKRMVVQGFV